MHCETATNGTVRVVSVKHGKFCAYIRITRFFVCVSYVNGACCYDYRVIYCFRCQCGHCCRMPTSVECVCCHDVRQIKQKVEGLEEQVGCITAHPGFRTVCLDIYCLETAYYAYKQDYGRLNFDLHEYVTQHKSEDYHSDIFAYSYTDKRVKYVVHCITQINRSDT